MTTPYGERLVQAMEIANLRGPDARTKLAKAAGVSVQAVGQVINGQTKAFSAESHARAARFLRVDPFWLATGEGEPHARGLSDETMNFARQYELLDARERERWRLLVQVARNGVPGATIEKAPPSDVAPPPAHREKAKQQ